MDEKTEWKMILPCAFCGKDLEFTDIYGIDEKGCIAVCKECSPKAFEQGIKLGGRE